MISSNFFFSAEAVLILVLQKAATRRGSDITVSDYSECCTPSRKILEGIPHILPQPRV